MKIVLWFCGSWALPVMLSLMFAGMTAAATSGFGASAVGPVMLGVIGVEALFFFGGTFVFARRLPDLGVERRWPLVLGHAAVQAGTFALLAFSMLVLFNR